jgi:hypothetical protein
VHLHPNHIILLPLRLFPLLLCPSPLSLKLKILLLFFLLLYFRLQLPSGSFRNGLELLLPADPQMNQPDADHLTLDLLLQLHFSLEDRLLLKAQLLLMHYSHPDHADLPVQTGLAQP